MKEPSDLQRGRPLYIVDGYNVILNRKSFHAGKSLEESREHLTRLIDSYASRKKIDITVVWDGDGSYYDDFHRGRRVKNIYTASNQNADDRIVKIVERMQNRKRAIVVSDDRRHITGIIRNLGAKSMGVSEFLNRIGFSRLKRGHAEEQTGGGARGSLPDINEEKNRADDISVEDWLKIFKSGKS